MQSLTREVERTAVLVDAGPQHVLGELTLPGDASGLVVIVNGLGARWSYPRDRTLADAFARDGLAVLSCDLFTEDEVAVDRITRHLRHDAQALAERVAAVVAWLRRQRRFAHLPIGLFGTGTGAAASVIAAATSRRVVGVVACGARTELPRDTLDGVRCPLLFVAGAEDGDTIASHCRTVRQVRTVTSTHLVKRASHLHDPIALAEVAVVSAAWFAGCLEGSGECALASAA